MPCIMTSSQHAGMLTPALKLYGQPAAVDYGAAVRKIAQVFHVIPKKIKNHTPLLWTKNENHIVGHLES